MFEKEAEEYAIGLTYPKFQDNQIANIVLRDVEGAFQQGAQFGYNKANEWQTGEPIKGREIFARNIVNCNLLATYFEGAWRNVWNGAVVDFNKITMWRYTGFKNNGEKIAPSKEIEK